MKPIHHFWFSMFACTVLLALLVAIAEAATPAEAYGRIPLHFEANQGQADPAVRFVARQGRGSVLLTRTGLTITSETATISLRAVGGGEVEPVGELPLTSRSRYYRPDGVVVAPHVSRVRYPQIYPGVDLVYYGDPQRLEHDFVVAAGADPAPICWQIEGVERLSLGTSGDLMLHAGDGVVELLAPVAYQYVDGRRSPVDASFELLANNTVSFRLGAYDEDHELVIDPVLEYGTYLGGERADSHAAIQVNEAGEAYVVGATRSLDFPVTGAAQDVYAGGACGSGSIIAGPCFDVFVAKLNRDGSGLVWATYFGGSGNDLPADAALSASGELAIAGTTESRDFPASDGALQSASIDTATARADAFAIQLSASGRLIYSTLLGGSGVDQATAVAIEEDGSTAIVGHTKSSNFPTTANAAQAAKSGDGDQADVFFTRLSPGGDALLYSTYLGRPLEERGGGVAALGRGRYAISGSTASPQFPLDAEGRVGSPVGRADAFVAFFDDQRYLGASLIGGSGNDAGGELESDGADGVFLIGSTDSRDLPTTAGAPLPVWKRSLGFLAHLSGTPFNPIPQRPDLLTYMVGSADELAVDSAGGVWVAGVTASSSPIFGGSLAPGCEGSLLRRFINGRLAYSGLTPGLGDIAIGPDRSIFSAGTDAGGKLRTTDGAWQSEPAGRSDVYVAKWKIAEDDEISLTCVEHGASFTPGEVAPGQLVTLFGSGLGRLNAAGLIVDQGRVATEIDGIQVLFNDEPAPLLFVWWNQINAVTPYGIAGSDEVEIVVVKDGVRSEPFLLPVAEAHPGLFTRDSTGSGVGALLNSDNTINTAENPAAVGSVVTLFGTGGGRPDRPVADGQVTAASLDNLARPTLPVTVMIGDQSAEVSYVGAAPELVAGVLQINVRIPAGTPPGLAPVRVTIGGKFNRQPVFVAVQ